MASSTHNVFGTERQNRRKGACVVTSFSDQYSKSEFIWSSDSSYLHAHYLALYNINKKHFNFSNGGMYGMSTLKVVSATAAEAAAAAGQEEKPYSHTALLPADQALRSFAKPQEFAVLLLKSGKDVVNQYRAENAGILDGNLRIPAERCYTVAKHVQKAPYGKAISHVSEYEMQVSSFGYKAATLKELRPPPIDMFDLKFLLKIRSTINSKVIVDKTQVIDGFAYDSHGYNNKLLHWVNWLRSKAFKKFHSDIRAKQKELGYKLPDLDEEDEESYVDDEEGKRVEESAAASAAIALESGGNKKKAMKKRPRVVTDTPTTLSFRTAADSEDNNDDELVWGSDPEIELATKPPPSKKKKTRASSSSSSQQHHHHHHISSSE